MWLSFHVAICMSWMDMHVGRSVVPLKEDILNFMPCISWALSSVWFCFNNQYAKYRTSLVFILNIPILLKS